MLILYIGCIAVTIAFTTYITYVALTKAIELFCQYSKAQKNLENKFANSLMINPSNHAITNNQYWDLFDRFQHGELTSTEESFLYIQGCKAEKDFRELDSTLLPLSDEFAEARSLPVEKIDRKLMIAVGLTMVGMSAAAEDRSKF